MQKKLSIAFLIVLAATVCVAADEDPYLWLEEVENEKALAWTKERSATGANLTHRVYMGALTYAYMWMMLK